MWQLDLSKLYLGYNIDILFMNQCRLYSVVLIVFVLTSDSYLVTLLHDGSQISLSQWANIYIVGVYV